MRATLGDDGPCIAETVTPDGEYRYQLLAGGTTVLVQKASPGGWKTTYVIRHGICPCLGSQNRGTCKHVDIAQRLTRWARENLYAVS